MIILAVHLLLGAFFFAFQIYGDFSGYSDIAIGTARLFGFTLMKNFAFPYFSRDIAEFWRRWHISLSSWFRDYVYIPLGGSRGSLKIKVRNIFVIFLVSGFWHGANWTFIVWGLVNAIYFMPLMLLKKNRINTNNVAEGKLLPNFVEILQIFITFLLTLIAWIFFRSETLNGAFNYLSIVFSSSLFVFPQIQSILFLLVLTIFILIEWVQREKNHALELSQFSLPKLVNWSFYSAIIFVILIYGGKQHDFIYFQF